MARSRLTAISASWVQAILLPQPPELTYIFKGHSEFSMVNELEEDKAGIGGVVEEPCIDLDRPPRGSCDLPGRMTVARVLTVAVKAQEEGSLFWRWK